MHISFSKINFLVISTLLFLCLNCRTKNKYGSTKTTARFNNSSQVEGLLLVEDYEVNLDTQVSPFELDESEFRIDGVRVLEQEFLKYQTPIITFKIPSKANYIEIIRCPANAAIWGGTHLIKNVESKANSIEEETKVYQGNNFWIAALKGYGCKVVAEKNLDNYFVDTLAETGKIKYYLRACVNKDRLDMQESGSSRQCSVFVARSNELDHISKRSSIDKAIEERAKKIENKMSKIAQEITQKFSILGSLAAQCAKNNNTNFRLTKGQKEGFTGIIGLSVGGGVGGLLGAGYGAYRAKPGSSRAIEGIKGGLIGAAGGALIGYLIESIDKSFSTQIHLPESSPSCYKRDAKGVDKAIRDYLTTQSSNKKPFKACSCADVKALKTDINNLKATIETYITQIKSLRGIKPESQDKKEAPNDKKEKKEQL